MKTLIVVALLPLLGFATETRCTTGSCMPEHDETSLVQIKKNIKPGNKRSQEIKLVSRLDEKMPDLQEIKLTEKPRKGAELKVVPESLEKDLSSVTLVATVGKSKWLFWFRHALKNAEEREAWYNHKLNQDIWAAKWGDGFPWRWDHVYDGDWMPWSWMRWRHEPWQDIVGRAIENGRRWANVGRSIDWGYRNRWGPFPSWRNNWEVAAALPLDPLADLDLYPQIDDIASTENYIQSARDAADNYAQAKAEADNAAADAWAANKAAGLT